MAVPGLRFRFSSAMSGNSNNTTTFYPVASAAGNCLVLHIQSSGVTLSSVTDNKSNTWVVVKSFSSNQNMYVAMATNVAAGTNTITFHWNTTGGSSIQFEYFEWYNISTSAPASVFYASQTKSNQTGSPVTTSNVTTVNANDVVIHWVNVDGASGPLSISKFTKGSGFTQATANLGGINQPTAMQYEVKATAGAVSPSMGITGTNPGADGIAYALVSASAGTAPPAGIWVAGQQNYYFDNTYPSNNLSFQMPITGNLAVLTITGGPQQGSTVTFPSAATSTTDSASNSWNISNTATSAFMFTEYLQYAKNIAANDQLTITANFSASPITTSFAVAFDIVGADTTAPLAQFVPGNGTQNVAGNVTFQTITPINQNSVIIIDDTIYSHTVSGMVAPTSANGGAPNLAVYAAADGGGTNAYDDDDLHGYWYNGTSTSAQAITASIQNNTAGVQYYNGFAAEFKALASSTYVPPVPSIIQQAVQRASTW